MMPRKNGWEVLDELRAEPVTRDLPVVLTSAVYDRIGRRPLPFGGPIRFASKPFDVTELIDTIEGFRTRQTTG
jgi:CheY-like chemotaxis protein